MDPALSFTIVLLVIVVIYITILLLVKKNNNKKFSNELKVQQENEVLTNLFGTNACSYKILSCEASINPDSLLKLTGKSLVTSIGAMALTGGRVSVHYSNETSTYMLIYGNQQIILIPAYYNKKNKQIMADYDKMLVFDNSNISKTKYSMLTTTINLTDNQKVKFELKNCFLGVFRENKEQLDDYKEYIKNFSI